MRFIISIFILAATLYGNNFNYIVKEELLKTRMAQEFPIVKETMFLTFRISDPTLRLDGKKQRFHIRAKLEIPNIRDDKGRVATAYVTFSSRIAYSKGGNLYLRKIKTEKIESDFIGDSMKSMLYGAIDQAMNEYFKSRPVYSLKEEKGLVGMAVKSIKNVVIVNEGLKIVFNMGQ